ncbi:hypothetical protein MKCMC460_61250 (plasmid) [Mycobacterium sp. 20KCMC460]|uniref:site-specific integrase n=1 Tax=Mycobacterium sp. 20KCMC460 TaxID=2903536 RepID=UPI001EE38672|nr:site-specific integrase [Mycobacterium sp. 20KCMC460]BDE17265.1 hypothetical protein MKCMC460_61250 [Mycobacterium sp. 20KCMC460]
MKPAASDLRLEGSVGWRLAGPAAGRYGLVNEYLGYLADRNYSPKTVRAYGFDLLAFCRWLESEDAALGEVNTDMLLRFLAACREARLPGRPGPNVVTMAGRPADAYAATTINRRLAAISGMFAFRAMRDPDQPNPVPKGREARRVVPGEKTGLLGHTVRKPRPRSTLRLREPETAAAAADQRAGRRTTGKSSYVAGSGNRRVDAVLRAALVRGARPGCD